LGLIYHFNRGGREKGLMGKEVSCMKNKWGPQEKRKFPFECRVPKNSKER